MDLAIEKLACRRGGRMVFRDLSARVPAGGVLVVRGPNGVGKSSLLRVLAGFVPVAAGEVRLGGTRLGAGREGWHGLVSYAGHLDAVKPALTVAENLATWAGILGGAARVGAALEQFGLAEIAGRPAAQCSAGQRRRLGLARLLLVDRPLWLLDEPTVALDAASAALVAELVRGHCASGGLAVIATHADLGLDGAAILEMAPVSAAPSPTAPAEDAFLAGTWEKVR